MNMHPADIANELKKNYYFSVLQERFLFQLATLIELKSYQSGECLLVEGQNNSNLYFLRTGVIEVYRSGKKITELTKVGEVMGEMSVITSQVASTTLLAQNQVEVFTINTTNFDYIIPSEKHFFELLLHKIYCHILVDRLNKANSQFIKSV